MILSKNSDSIEQDNTVNKTIVTKSDEHSFDAIVHAGQDGREVVRVRVHSLIALMNRYENSYDGK